MPETPIVVAIVNTNPDLVRLLRVNLEAAGYVVIVIHIEDIKTASGDVEAIIERHNPRVVIYDIVPPYDVNWRFFDHLRTTSAFHGRHFVITTVNISQVQRIVGKESVVYEVVGEASDIQQVVRAVKEASKARAVK
jgi:DNA-binding response OmpR family regulator